MKSGVTRRIGKPVKKKSMKLGGGGRFKKMVGKLKAKGESKHEAKAVAAKIGMEKYGKKKMEKMAAKGKRRKHPKSFE